MSGPNYGVDQAGGYPRYAGDGGGGGSLTHQDYQRDNYRQVVSTVTYIDQRRIEILFIEEFQALNNA